MYHEDAGDSFDVTIGFPVSTAPDPSLGLEIVELPGGPALRVVHKGQYDTLGGAYRALEAELTARGMRRTLSWERYVTGPGDDPDSANWTTEVLVPLVEQQRKARRVRGGALPIRAQRIPRSPRNLPPVTR